MTKQTKMIKFMLAILIIIPVTLLVTGLVQTFVLKSKQAELANAQTQLEQSTDQYNNLEDEYNYKTSDEYLEEYHKYHNGYGNEGDIVLEYPKQAQDE